MIGFSTGTGTATVATLTVVPFVLAFSKSRLVETTSGGIGIVYAVHITPFIAIGFVNPFGK